MVARFEVSTEEFFKDWTVDFDTHLNINEFDRDGLGICFDKCFGIKFEYSMSIEKELENFIWNVGIVFMNFVG